MADYHYFGEFTFDGATYDAGFKVEDLRTIRDDLELCADDIVVATYPKAGTTWTQEIVWCLQYGPDSKREKSFDDVFPFLEMDFAGKCGLRLLETAPKPRMVKTHLHGNFFKRQLEGKSTCPRFIVVVRNPKDVLVSFYHFHRSFEEPYTYPGTWDDFFQYMIKDNRVVYGDYFDHVVSWAQHRSHHNVHYIRYEDMKKDARNCIRGIADFLRIPVTEEKLDAVVHATSFETMKSRPAEQFSDLMKDYTKDNTFFRKGQVGGWKGEINEDQLKYIEDMAKLKLLPAGITFD